MQAIADEEALERRWPRSSGDAAARNCSPTARPVTGVSCTAEEVNDYIKRTAGGEFTAKDFRTWNATVLAAVALAARADDARRTRPASGPSNAAIRTVAAYLGNTPAVCRASYVDPRVIDRFQGRRDDRSGAR